MKAYNLINFDFRLTYVLLYAYNVCKVCGVRTEERTGNDLGCEFAGSFFFICKTDMFGVCIVYIEEEMVAIWNG